LTAAVWYISKYVIPPGSGSAGGRGYLLMRELASAGVKVAVITSDSIPFAAVPDLKSAYLREHRDGLDLWWVRTSKYSVAKSFRRIVSWLDFEWRLFRMPKSDLPRPDAVVVSSLSLLTIVNGLLIRNRFRCRLVFEVRDIWPLTLTAEGGYSPKNPFVRALAWLERQAYRRADVIVGTMPNLREHVRAVLGYDRVVECIPMGYDDRDFALTQRLAIPSDLPEDYRRSFIPKGKFIIGHVGSIGITNALEVFLECARRVDGKADIHFLLVGNGDLKKEYQARYSDLKNITFAESVEKRLVPAVLSCCDLLYFSAYDSEVWRFGQSLNKVVDYMLSGKPILASYTGYRSMINESGCGEFVRAGDVDSLEKAVLRYSTISPAELEAMGRRGREWILANRSYKILANNYHEILFSSETTSQSG
jgi:glycosyltransferase involved in cell wall biosynthesis